MKELQRILVVDDEAIMRNMLRDALKKRSYDVTVAEDGAAATVKLNSEKFELVITDFYLPDTSGIDILKKSKEIDPNLGVILITAHGSIEKAVKAMKMGAYDFLTKGFSIGEIEVVIDKFFKYQKLVHENELLRFQLARQYGLEHIIGKGTKMRQLFETIEMVAPTKATVLIQGPSGTGKELVAHAIHQCSPRREHPFIKTNCAAIPETLMESELFGHEKGAFTGAIRSTQGRFEMADEGTLLLDEISEIKPNLQAKLLRVLQEKEFEKVGGRETLQVDVRIIATTNRDLKEEVQNGNFREDLYYRLNVVPIIVPPLRERKDDIPFLVEHFIAKYGKENNRSIKGIDDRALRLLMDYDWPGNVRELENMIERAVVICKKPAIMPLHLDFDVNGKAKRESKSKIVFPGSVTLKETEKQLIVHMLKRKRWNRTWTARQLGISVRTLRNKIKEYDIQQYPDSPQN